MSKHASKAMSPITAEQIVTAAPMHFAGLSTRVLSDASIEVAIPGGRGVLIQNLPEFGDRAGGWWIVRPVRLASAKGPFYEPYVNVNYFGVTAGAIARAIVDQVKGVTHAGPHRSRSPKSSPVRRPVIGRRAGSSTGFMGR